LCRRKTPAGVEERGTSPHPACRGAPSFEPVK